MTAIFFAIKSLWYPKAISKIGVVLHILFIAEHQRSAVYIFGYIHNKECYVPKN